MADFISAGMLGGNLSAADGPTPLSSQGIVTNWYNNTNYAGGLARYVYAVSAIAFHDALAIDTGGSAVPVSSVQASAGWWQFGCADWYLLNSGDYGWVKLTGPMSPNVLTLCAARVPLFTSGTAGKLDDTGSASSFTLVRGIELIVSNTGSTNSIAAMANWPAYAPGGTV